MNNLDETNDPLDCWESRNPFKSTGLFALVVATVVMLIVYTHMKGVL